MAGIKSVVDLLAEQPEPVLLQMRATIRADLERLSVEAQQVDAALAKKARRGGSRSAGAGAPDRGEGLTRWQVYEVVKALGRPVAPPEVRDALREQGHPHVTTPQVRSHMFRLADVNKSLIRLPDSTYVVSSNNGGTKNEADTPLSGDAGSQSQNQLSA
jgi:hypothetical protein